MINTCRFSCPFKKVVPIVFIGLTLVLIYFIVDVYRLVNRLNQYKKPLAILKPEESQKVNQQNCFVFQGKSLYQPTSEIVCLLIADSNPSWSSLLANAGIVSIEGVSMAGLNFYKREVTEHNMEWAVTEYNGKSALRFQFMKTIYPSSLIIKILTERNDINDVKIEVYPVIAHCNAAIALGVFIIAVLALILIVLAVKIVRKSKGDCGVQQ